MDDKDNDWNMRWASVVVYGFLILMVIVSVIGLFAVLHAEKVVTKPTTTSVKK